MKFGHATGYALKALVYLAGNGNGQSVASHDIAAAQGLPEKFLLKCLRPLVNAGLLRSVKGPSGGYRLAKPPRDITLLEVVEASEAPVRGLVPVFAEDAGAFDRRLQAACDNVAGVVRQNLEGVTVKHLAGGKKRR